MKRFHAHVAVDDLAASISFYSRLFGQAPTKTQADYAKWMLDDPCVNFAISARGGASGFNHFGIQADSAVELNELKSRALAASSDNLLDDGQAACCYARSEKHWTVDPQGLAWEHFYTTGDIDEYGQDLFNRPDACCVPLAPNPAVATDAAEPGSAEPACCIPSPTANDKADDGGCCR